MFADDGGAADPWERALGDILDGRGVSSLYQPIIDLRRGTVVGYEALARFAHPAVTGGPDEWFAAATDRGRAAELDAVTLRSALARRSELPANCFLTVNVEPSSLTSDAVGAVLFDGSDLGGVIVELTEHQPWDPLALAPVLDRLRGAGAHLAVDDAGVGYAGLQAILQLRPSLVKLDRALVEGVDRDEAKAALVEMVGVFANHLDAWVLAEGIETEAEARRVVDLDVPLGQGYYFGRPAAPWASIEPPAGLALASQSQAPRATLHRLMALAPSVRGGSTTADKPVVAGDDGWVVVIDGDDRPLGLHTAANALTGELVPALDVGLDDSPADIAHRLSTGVGDPSLPAVVHDHAGRYVGVVTLRRLLGHLAENSLQPVS